MTNLEQLEKDVNDAFESGNYTPGKRNWYEVRDGATCACALVAAYANRHKKLPDVSLNGDIVIEWASKRYDTSRVSLWHFIGGFDGRSLGNAETKGFYDLGKKMAEKWQPVEIDCQ